MADPMLSLACTLVTLLGVPGMILYTGARWSVLLRDVVILAAVWIAVGIVCALTGALPDGFGLLVPALGLVASAGVAASLAEKALVLRVRLFTSIGFALLLFLPLALVVFGWGGTWLYRDAGALDFAGAIPVAVGTGSMLTVVALAGRTTSVGNGVLALRGAMTIAAALLASAVGLELRVDELSPAIALNMLMTPAVALLAAAGVERIKRGRNTREGLAAGTLAGTAAAMASSAYLETVSALILGLLAGAVAEAAFRGASAAWRLATPLLIGGITGIVFLGVFALDVGFVYSGQPSLLLHQAMITAASLLFAAFVALVIVLPLRRIRIAVQQR